MSNHLMNNRLENVDSSHVLETINKWPSTRSKKWVENFVQTSCQQSDIWTIVSFRFHYSPASQI